MRRERERGLLPSKSHYPKPNDKHKCVYVAEWLSSVMGQLQLILGHGGVRVFRQAINPYLLLVTFLVCSSAFPYHGTVFCVLLAHGSFQC